jgi:hypothetical protein
LFYISGFGHTADIVGQMSVDPELCQNCYWVSENSLAYHLIFVSFCCFADFVQHISALSKLGFGAWFSLDSFSYVS